jgi:uroporphyrin-III C-methyltransferase
MPDSVVLVISLLSWLVTLLQSSIKFLESLTAPVAQKYLASPSVHVDTPRPQVAKGVLVSLKLDSKRILLVGSGRTVVARLGVLQRVGAAVTLVCPLAQLPPGACDGTFTHLDKQFDEEDLEGADLVIVTESLDIPAARALFLAARTRARLIHISGHLDLSDFSFIATFEQGPLQVGVTSNGCAPTLAKRVLAELKECLPANTGAAVERVGELRRRLQSLGSSAAAPHRIRWIKQICEFWPLEELARLSEAQLDELLKMFKDREVTTTIAPTSATQPRRTCPGPVRPRGAATKHEDKVVPNANELAGAPTLLARARIVLVGTGPGDVELMTVAAQEAVRTADVMLVDKLAPPHILALAPPHCEIHYARKFPGNANKAQQELNDLGLEALRRDKVVVRLKGGDPFLYGRGGEEVVWYQQHGFPVKIIPGISSALCAPLSAGIPVTHRGVASQLLILTGHSKEHTLPDLPAYNASRTVVVLMGLGHAEKLMQAAKAQGFPGDVPVAVVERASRPDQRVVKGTIDDICARVRDEKIESPATIVIGRVVNALDTETATAVEVARAAEASERLDSMSLPLAVPAERERRKELPGYTAIEHQQVIVV